MPENGRYYTQHKGWNPGEAVKMGLNVLNSADNDGLSTLPGHIHTGMNSGYQAINLAYQLGATVILLLGYDMGHSGKRHFFGDHPAGLRNLDDYSKYIAPFRTIQPEKYGIQIINCSRETRLDAFPRMELEQALENYTLCNPVHRPEPGTAGATAADAA